MFNSYFTLTKFTGLQAGRWSNWGLVPCRGIPSKRG